MRLRSVLILLAVVLLSACAQIVPPTGGIKDETAPVILLMEPQMGLTSFRSDRFRIYFDEYVQLDDIANELLVSPPLQNRPDVIVRKKFVEVRWDEELLPNTTYTFNFGEGIKDVNEGNIASVNYVFSTGPELDSLSIRGVVLDAFTNLPVKGARVMLYRNIVDSTPMTEKPLYFGRSGEDGRWEINYLKDEELGIFALKEEIGNYLYDSPTESIAFADTSIRPAFNDSLQFLTLRLAIEKDTTQYIEDWDSDSLGHLKLKLHDPREFVNIRSLNFEVPQEDWIQFKGKSDTLYIWKNTKPSGRELDLVISDKSVVLDTVNVLDFNRAYPTPYKLSCPARTFNNDSGIVLNLPSPIASFDTSYVSVTSDSIPQNFNLNYELLNPTQLKLDAKFESGKTYEFKLLPGAVTNPRYAQNDTLICTCQAFKDDYYSDLQLKVDLGEKNGHYIIQFIDKSGNVSKEYFIEGTTELSIKRTEPGTYKLRMIVDTDANRKWSSVSYATKIQAEKVYYFENDLILRSNWEQKLEWKVNLNQ